jgi:hypothetical protein
MKDNMVFARLSLEAHTHPYGETPPREHPCEEEVRMTNNSQHQLPDTCMISVVSSSSQDPDHQGAETSCPCQEVLSESEFLTHRLLEHAK